MKQSTWIGIIVVILVLGVLCMTCLLVGAVLVRPDLLSFSWPGGAGGRIVLALPVRHGESDLVLLRSGQSVDRGVVLAESARPGGGTIVTWRDGQTIPLGSPEYGGFTAQDELLLQAQLDGQGRLMRMSTSAREPEEIFESDTGRFTAYVGQGGQEILITDETGSGVTRCYLARPGEEVRRVARGDDCQVSADGATLLVSETASGRTDLTIIGVDGADEVRLLEGESDVQSSRLAPDGGQVAFVRGEGDAGTSLTVLARDGSPAFESGTFYAIASYGFAPSGRQLYYIAEGEAGDLELHTLDGQVASANTLDAAFTPDGENLVYLAAGQDGDGTVNVYSLAQGSSREIVSGEGLAFALLPSSEGILVRESVLDELSVYFAALDGAEPTDLFDEVGYYLQTAQVVPGQGLAYLLVQETGSSLSLYVASMETGDGYFALEGWADVQLLNLSPEGERLLLSGREDPGDPAELLLVELREGAEPVVLDEDLDAVLNAVFDTRARQVWYSVSTGTDPDEVEVRRVDADGDRPAEIAYAEGALVDVAWSDLRPFLSSYLTFNTGLTVTGYCPGATALQVGSPTEDELAAGGENCYSFRVSDGLEYTVRVLAAHPDLDSRLYLYDRQGRQIAEDDDGGPGLNPRLWVTLDSPGLYFVTVVGFGSEDAGAYSIELRQGLGNLGFPTAERLDFDAVVQGAITADDEIYLQSFNWTIFGRMYTFEAGAEDWIEIDVDPETRGGASMIGLILFDPGQMQIAYGSADIPGPDLQASLPVGGQYYVLVGMLDESVPSQEVFYDISLVQGEAPEPGGGPISYGETLEGYVISPLGDEWTFEGEQGDEVTITMRSSAIDSTLSLRGPDGTELRYDDDGAGYPDSMILGFRLPQTGTYTILARSLGGNLGAYTLSLELGAPGAGGEITRGQAVEGDLQGGTRDRWTFQGEVGERVTIVMASNFFDTYLELYGPDGQLLTANDDAGSTSRSEIADFSLPATGEYEILARAYWGDAGGGYTLELR